MCGIVGIHLRRRGGYTSPTSFTLKNVFKEMLVAAEARGASATGVMLVNKSRYNAAARPRVVVLRSPLKASDFVESEDFKEFTNKISDDTHSIIGHTRAPSGNSASARNNKNNHPHNHGVILGVHNGRVINDSAIWKALEKEGVQRKSKCDSEAIFALISYLVDNGCSTIEAIEKTVETVKGWMATAAINAREPEKVYLFRDKESDLALAQWRWPETTLFASKYSYIEEAVKGKTHADSLIRLSMEPMQLITLDSSLKGKDGDMLFADIRTLSEDVEEKKKVMEEFADDYKVTQGK